MPRLTAQSRARLDQRATTPERARILQVARSHFFAEGFQAFTMDDLASELGVSKKTLYRHFPTKEAVLDAVLDDLAGEVGAVLSAARDAADSSVARQLPGIMDGISKRLAPVRPAFIRSLRRHAPRQFERLEALRRRNLEEYLVPLLRRGRDRGEVRAEIDPQFVIEILLHVLDGLFATDLLNRVGRTPAAAAAGVLDLFFRGILATSRKAPR